MGVWLWPFGLILHGNKLNSDLLALGLPHHAGCKKTETTSFATPPKNPQFFANRMPTSEPVPPPQSQHDVLYGVNLLTMATVPVQPHKLFPHISGDALGVYLMRLYDIKFFDIFIIFE